MPGNRRLRLSIFLLAIILLTLIYMQTAGDATRANSFYTRTSAALAQREAEEKDGKAIQSDDSAVQQRLKEAADKARQSANEKAEKGYQLEVKKAAEKANVAEHVKGELKEAKAKEEDEIKHKDMVMAKEDGEKVLASDKKTSDEEERAKAEAEKKERERREKKAKETLDTLLDKHQILIFSKTFCPYSRKAKHILLDLYTITPVPHVVELNQLDIGPDLQAVLGRMTGRRTVPNILIKGKSIGGGDDIEQLHMAGKLSSKITDILGKGVEIVPAKVDKIDI